MFISAFILGLSSTLHCLGMCGPIVLSLQFPSNNNITKIIHGLTYNFARIFSYVLLGMMTGGIGNIVAIFGVQQYFSFTIGILLLLGIALPALSKKIQIFSRLYAAIVAPIRTIMSSRIRQKGLSSAFIMGFFNGFLPCGMVAVALAGSLVSGSTLQGMTFMALFGLGTLPIMFGLVYYSPSISVTFKKRLSNITPALTLLFAFLLILRGLNIDIPYLSPSISTEAGKLHSNCCHKAP